MSSLYNPYQIVKHVYRTEKAETLKNLQISAKTRELKRYKQNKYVFVVDPKADKRAIAIAVEAIYADQKIKVVKVNTLRVKARVRRFRGRYSQVPGFKKAIVTLAEGDIIENY